MVRLWYLIDLFKKKLFRVTSCRFSLLLQWDSHIRSPVSAIDFIIIHISARFHANGETFSVYLYAPYMPAVKNLRFGKTVAIMQHGNQKFLLKISANLPTKRRAGTITHKRLSSDLCKKNERSGSTKMEL